MNLEALLLSLTLFCSQQTLASSDAIEFTHDPKSAIKAKISELAPTRINFGGLQITEVIGDENKYKITADSNGFNVFITPKVGPSSILPITLIAGSNIVQDLLLEVSASKKLPSSIIIEHNLNKPREERSELELMLRAMLRGDNPNDKYYITKRVKKLTIPSFPKLSITQDKAWRFKNLKGISLTVTNKDKIAIYLRKEHISNLLKDTKFIIIDNDLLKKGANTRVLVITEEEE